MIYNFFYSSEFKNSNESNNDFNIILDENIVINETDKAFIKINNISFLNNMFNISQYHENDYFDIIIDSITTRIYLTDGNYNVYTFRDKINSLLSTYNFMMVYDNVLMKYKYYTTLGSLIINPYNLKNFFGLNNNTEINTYYIYSDKIDFRSYNKIIITNNLTLKNNPYNNLISSYSSSSGMGSILCWINRNEVPYSTINYNNEDLLNEIEDKNIKNINFKIFNEYREQIKDLSDIQIQFQIIIKENKIFNKLLSKIKLLSNIR
jgi:hypothetical protein